MKHPIHIQSDPLQQTSKSKIARRLVVPTLAALLLAVPLGFKPQPVLSQVVHLVEVDVKVAAAGYRASKLIGKTVLNDTGEKVGTLDDIILGSDYKANFAIIEVGGFLGIGAHLVAVPFESLTIDKGSGKIVLPGATKTALEKLAEFKYMG